jgi:hypothetical protein
MSAVLCGERVVRRAKPSLDGDGVRPARSPQGMALHPSSVVRVTFLSRRPAFSSPGGVVTLSRAVSFSRSRAYGTG